MPDPSPRRHLWTCLHGWQAFGELSRAAESRLERVAEGGAGRGMRSSPLAGMSGRTRRSEEFVEQGHNGDADDQQRAELDGEFLFHFLDVAFQFSSGNLKVGLDFVNVVL